ncbi:MAG: hypothetical protein SF029_21745 [bacterium]|nr:hypothetical protein [bacterium]
MAADELERYPHGISREWEDDRRIVIISTQGDMSQAAIDVWANLVIRTVQEWPHTEPVYILHDLSSRNQGFTPYSRKRAEDTYRAVQPDQMVYIAVVLRDGFINNLISVFLRRRKGARQNIREQVFTSRFTALDWLRGVRQTQITSINSN